MIIPEYPYPDPWTGIIGWLINTNVKERENRKWKLQCILLCNEYSNVCQDDYNIYRVKENDG